MLQDTVRIMNAIVSGIWTLFTSWELPGLGFSPAQLLFFLLIVPLIIKVVKSLISLTMSQFGGHE